MVKTANYINEVLGIKVLPEPIPKYETSKLPFFINGIYELFQINLFDKKLLLAEPKEKENFSIMRTEKNFTLLKNTLNRKVVLVLPELTYINRKRLIEKGINFIVPGKQLFIPELLIDLKEDFSIKQKNEGEHLLPSAQFLLIYHIIHRSDKWQLEDHSFKEIAEKINYTSMAVTKAVEDLKRHELIDITGRKEKFIKFKLQRHELWQEAEKRKILINPVLKRIFVDEKPEIFMLKSNISALTEYSDINPDNFDFFALPKTKYYELREENKLVNENDLEGQICLEIWKYDPVTLVRELPDEALVVDPLSLYLSLKEDPNDRIEMALDQIINNFIW